MYTTADLVASVRRRAQRPEASADGAVSDADILQFADDHLSLDIVPMVRSAREEHWVTSLDIPLSEAGPYHLPGRAQASGLRDVTLVRGDGVEWSIPRISVERRGDYSGTGGATSGRGVGFVVEGNKLHLLPPGGSTSASTLRMRYHRSHPRLVPVEEAMRVSSAVVSGESVTGFSLVESTWLSSWQPNPGLLDLLWGSPPYGLAAADIAVSDFSVGSPDEVALAAGPSEAIFSELRGRDASTLWLALSGESPIVDLPAEVIPLLVTAVVAEVLESTGDRDGAAMKLAKLQEQRTAVLRVLEPRVEGARERIVPRTTQLRRGGSQGGWS